MAKKKEDIDIVKIKINDKPLPRMFSMEDVRQHLGVSPATMSKIAKTEGFPATRIGRRVLVSEDEYLEWLEKIKGTEVFL